MSGGWKNSDRKERLPSNWVGLRSQILHRAGGRCEISEPMKTGGLLRRCWRKATDVDHIVAGDDHRPENLQGICRYHHGKKTAQEGVDARRTPPAKRAPEKHPGARS